MKQINLAVMSVAIIGAGLLGVTSTSLFDVTESNVQTYGETTGLLGHVTAVQTDQSGNIISYSQSDNLVVDDGEDCLAFLTFGSLNKTSTCAADQGFNEIALYANTENPDDADDVFGSATADFYSVSGLAPCNLEAVNDGSTTGGYEDRYNGITSTGDVFLQCTFTALADSLQVQGAMINNNATSSAMFAAKNFTGDAGLTLNTNDKLTITWAITLG